MAQNDIEEERPLTVGDILYRQVFDSYRKQNIIEDFTVTKIGRKYIYAKCDYKEVRIIKERNTYRGVHYDFPYHNQFYRDKQEIFNKNERLRLQQLLRKFVSALGTIDNILPLEKLQQVCEILGIDYKPKTYGVIEHGTNSITETA